MKLVELHLSRIQKYICIFEENKQGFDGKKPYFNSLRCNLRTYGRQSDILKVSHGKTVAKSLAVGIVQLQFDYNSATVNIFVFFTENK